MSTQLLSYHTPTNVSTVEIRTIGQRRYRIGERITGGFYVKEVRSGSRLDFYSREALDWFIDQLERAAGEPLPPVIASVSVAQESHMKENVIKVTNAPAGRGEMMHKGAQGINGMVQAINQFRVKHGGRPNLIKLNSQDRPDMTSFDGITVEHTDAVPTGRVWVGVK